MSYVRRLGIALVLGAAVVAALGGAAALAADSQHHSQNALQSQQVACDPVLTPDQGPPGTVVAGRFIDTEPMREFNVFFLSDGAAPALVAHGHADMLGVALFSFTVPSGAADGDHIVQLRDISGGCTYATIFKVGPALPTVTPPTAVPTTPAPPPAVTVTPTVAPPSAGNGGNSGLQLRDVTPAALALFLFGITCFILAMSRRPRPMVVYSPAARRDVATREEEPVSHDTSIAHESAPKRGAFVAAAAVVAGAVAVWFSRKR